MTEEQRIAIINKAVNDLREFFPQVQVLVSWTGDDGHTYDCFRGKGNWYARVGMAREFQNRDESQTTAKELSDVIHEDED